VVLPIIFMTLIKCGHFDRSSVFVPRNNVNTAADPVMSPEEQAGSCPRRSHRLINCFGCSFARRSCGGSEVFLAFTFRRVTLGRSFAAAAMALPLAVAAFNKFASAEPFGEPSRGAQDLPR
jgi:hypothetical protein